MNNRQYQQYYTGQSGNPYQQHYGGMPPASSQMNPYASYEANNPMNPVSGFSSYTPTPISYPGSYGGGGVAGHTATSGMYAQQPTQQSYGSHYTAGTIGYNPRQVKNNPPVGSMQTITIQSHAGSKSSHSRDDSSKKSKANEEDEKRKSRQDSAAVRHFDSNLTPGLNIEILPNSTLRCKVCKTSCGTGLKEYFIHMNSAKHGQAVFNHLVPYHSEHSRYAKEWHYCEICDVKMKPNKNYVDHVFGKPHIKRARQLMQLDAPLHGDSDSETEEKNSSSTSAGTLDQSRKQDSSTRRNPTKSAGKSKNENSNKTPGQRSGERPVRTEKESPISRPMERRSESFDRSGDRTRRDVGQGGDLHREEHRERQSSDTYKKPNVSYPDDKSRGPRDSYERREQGGNEGSWKNSAAEYPDARWSPRAKQMQRQVTEMSSRIARQAHDKETYKEDYSPRVEDNRQPRNETSQSGRVSPRFRDYNPRDQGRQGAGGGRIESPREQELATRSNVREGDRQGWAERDRQQVAKSNVREEGRQGWAERDREQATKSNARDEGRQGWPERDREQATQSKERQGGRQEWAGRPQTHGEDYQHQGKMQQRDDQRTEDYPPRQENYKGGNQHWEGPRDRTPPGWNKGSREPDGYRQTDSHQYGAESGRNQQARDQRPSNYHQDEDYKGQDRDQLPNRGAPHQLKNYGHDLRQERTADLGGKSQNYGEERRGDFNAQATQRRETPHQEERPYRHQEHDSRFAQHQRPLKDEWGEPIKHPEDRPRERVLPMRDQTRSLREQAPPPAHHNPELGERSGPPPRDNYPPRQQNPFPNERAPVVRDRGPPQEFHSHQREPPRNPHMEPPPRGPRTPPPYNSPREPQYRPRSPPAHGPPSAAPYRQRSPPPRGPARDPPPRPRTPPSHGPSRELPLQPRSAPSWDYQRGPSPSERGPVHRDTEHPHDFGPPRGRYPSPRDSGQFDDYPAPRDYPPSPRDRPVNDPRDFRDAGPPRRALPPRDPIPPRDSIPQRDRSPHARGQPPRDPIPHRDRSPHARGQPPRDPIPHRDRSPHTRGQPPKDPIPQRDRSPHIGGQPSRDPIPQRDRNPQTRGQPPRDAMPQSHRSPHTRGQGSQPRSQGPVPTRTQTPRHQNEKGNSVSNNRQPGQNQRPTESDDDFGHAATMAKKRSEASKRSRSPHQKKQPGRRGDDKRPEGDGGSSLLAPEAVANLRRMGFDGDPEDFVRLVASLGNVGGAVPGVVDPSVLQTAGGVLPQPPAGSLVSPAQLPGVDNEAMATAVQIMSTVDPAVLQALNSGDPRALEMLQGSLDPRALSTLAALSPQIVQTADGGGRGRDQRRMSAGAHGNNRQRERDMRNRGDRSGRLQPSARRDQW